jgi:uncharacterized membrane protein YoaK (UPF0700 family)
VRKSDLLKRAHLAPRGTRHRDVLVVILTLCTGALDAVCFLRLGRVFSSVITGNLALLGIAVGEKNGGLAASGGLTLAGYAAGVVLGTFFAGTTERGQPVWPRRVTVTLAVELGILLAFNAGWLISGSHRGTVTRMVLLVLAATAMGVQTAAVRRLGQMSTTYLTSTLTGLFAALAIRRMPEDWQRSIGVIVALVVGAIFGSLAATQSPSWVPVAVLVPQVCVLLGSLARPSEPARPLQTPPGPA